MIISNSSLNIFQGAVFSSGYPPVKTSDKSGLTKSPYSA
ncbi:hypothetical protein PM8797T_06957 [Gimesia maris DSM 8797]|nr:hypothetical protein PM8797T_06957 [Gimesia maris DSM 8797]